MRKHRQPGIDTLENARCFIGVRVLLRNRSRLPSRKAPSIRHQFVRRPNQCGIVFGPRRDLMDEDIYSLREFHEVVRGLRVSGDDNGVATVVNSVPERRLGDAVIDEKRRDLHACCVTHHAFTNVCREDRDPLGREDVASNLNIECESVMQMIGNREGSFGLQDLYGCIENM